MFWAVLIGRPAASTLRSARRDLASAGADVKWVSDDHFHMTLAFLGKQKEDRIPAAIAAGQYAAQFTPAFTLRFNCLGAFPNWESPKILWSGLGEGGEALKSLASKLRDKLVKEGFDEEKRPFEPHATLGRLRSPKGRRALVDRTERWRGTQAWEGAVSVIGSMILFESHLTSAGPSYIPIVDIRLAG